MLPKSQCFCLQKHRVLVPITVYTTFHMLSLMMRKKFFSFTLCILALNTLFVLTQMQRLRPKEENMGAKVMQWEFYAAESTRIICTELLKCLTHSYYLCCHAVGNIMVYLWTSCQGQSPALIYIYIYDVLRCRLTSCKIWLHPTCQVSF